MPTVVALVPSLELLVLVRNGVAHLGEATADDGDDVLVPYLKASEELRGALDLDREAYWGEFVELVDSALKENVEKARLRAESALAIARRFSSEPLLATVLFLVTPAFIVNGTSLEADLPFIAFFLASIALCEVNLPLASA